MTRPLKIAPSLLSADFARLGEEVAAMEAAGCDYLHVDVMDGHFVPNLTIGAPVVSALRQVATKPLDVHLMIAPVEPLLADFAKAGADIISFHPEAASDAGAVVEQIIGLGARAGIVLNPTTPEDIIVPYIQRVSLVLQMTVQPGFGGQTFIATSPAKIARVRALMEEHASHAELEVDGGITAKTAPLCIAAGADVLVAGTACFAGGASAYAANIAALRASGGA